MKKILFLVSLLFIAIVSFSQKARITGKVINSRNEALAGVNVKPDAGAATQTNVEGRFTIIVEAGKKINLSFSYVGYTTKTINDISVNANAEEILDIVLEESGKKLDEVVVKGAANRGSQRGETVNALIAFQKNTNTVASVISAEAIRRSPDKNTGEVLKRTPGASVQDGKFLVVRGLADRYNLAMLNGIVLGSTEPDRKAFSFDLIPAGMIDNIIINKAFVPELPGEWAGGLVQVNTKDIPTKNFFNIQIGSGFNTQAHFNDFYKSKNAGKTDWLGIDDGSRSLPDAYTTKSRFDILTAAEKNEIGKSMGNSWSAIKGSALPNFQFQASGGFSKKLKGEQQIGGLLGINYNASTRFTEGTNDYFQFLTNGTKTPDFAFNEKKYARDVTWGAVGSLTYQLNNKNKLSVKSLFNVTSSNYTTDRVGVENLGNAKLDSIKANEFAFVENIFWNTQLTGEHTLNKSMKFKWYGSFSVLDNYVPDQRRIYYNKDNTITTNPYTLLLSGTLSQKSGNRYYQNLNDYIYTAGGDIAKTYDMFGLKQTVKVGYLFQVKDRLFDAKPFSLSLQKDNPALRLKGPETVFDPSNYGDGSTSSNLLTFGAIQGSLFRYVANTILNAGYLQFDNQFTNALRVVWGLRVENYDQLVGSVKVSDPRHSYSEVRDFLPGINLTYKLNNKTNIRISGSQTVVRPEFREIANFQYYNFDLNASVQGSSALQRTKVANFDIRYELFPGAGEVFTAGVFYKHFTTPIEVIFQPSSGGASTYNYQNAANANAYGLELEARKKLDFTTALKNFTIQANLAYIYSKVKDEVNLLDRPLQGQSPYVINVGLMYDLEKQGISSTLLFNQIGKRIAFVGNVDPNGVYQPDIYENSRPVVDFQFTKKVLKNKAELRLNVSDIFNKKLYFYQNNDGNTKLNKDTDAIRFTKKYGTTFSLTFGYTL